MRGVLAKLTSAFAIWLAIFAFVGCSSTSSTQVQSKDDIVPAKYGQLQVIGTQLCDVQGKPIQLKGMGTMGLQWYGGIVNKTAFKALAKDWQCDVIRLALYVGENGYASRPSLKDLVVKGVELAIQEGMYVIIDWHVLSPGNPNDPVYSGAKAFFNDMSKRFGKYPNVIYEIMNEPNGAAMWDNGLKTYAEKMVATIRVNDPDNIILIGSSSWSQDVDLASMDPVAGTNLMYTFHFYAGTHGNSLRNKVKFALDNGVAVFCSEWGTSSSNGSGGPFLDRADEWLKFLDEKKISWVNWSLCNKNETSAAFKSLLQEFQTGKGTVTVQKDTPLEPAVMGAAGYPIWPVSQLSLSGNYVRAKIKGIDVPSDDKDYIRFWDFEKNGTADWGIANDSPVKPALTRGEAQSGALTFSYNWSTTPVGDGWTTAPRLKISDMNLPIGRVAGLDFDLYLQAGKNVAAEFEVTPILQYPPSYWKQLTAVKLNYASGKDVGKGLLKYSCSVPVSVAKDTTLAHLMLVVSGNGTGYDGSVFVDNIGFVAGNTENSTQADSSKQETTASTEDTKPAEVGAFNGLPWNFQDSTLQGWALADDTPAKVNLTMGTAESNALAFSFEWTLPGASDTWSTAPRISSSWVSLAGKDYKTLSLDFYIEAAAAKAGSMQVQPVIQSPEHGYWFQLKPKDIKFSEGNGVGKGLLKYSCTFQLLNTSGAPLKSNAIIRNLILITVGVNTNYKGKIYYDNITFK